MPLFWSANWPPTLGLRARFLAGQRWSFQGRGPLVTAVLGALGERVKCWNSPLILVKDSEVSELYSGTVGLGWEYTSQTGTYPKCWKTISSLPFHSAFPCRQPSLSPVQKPSRSPRAPLDPAFVHIRQWTCLLCPPLTTDHCPFHCPGGLFRRYLQVGNPHTFHSETIHSEFAFLPFWLVIVWTQ